MKVALPIHGMNSRTAGRDSIDRLAHGLAVDIVDTDDADYDFALFLRIWFFKGPLIERIAGGIKKWIDDDRITQIYLPVHSNGLNFSLQALKLLEKRGQRGKKAIIIVSFSGCANRKVNTDVATVVHNWYTERDGWLKAAKLLPSWTMGSFGLGPYRGKSTNVIDKRITNHISEHSQWFKGYSLSMAIRKHNELIRSYS
jgi:hypothetical protein